jgi:hypothetical protein
MTPGKHDILTLDGVTRSTVSDATGDSQTGQGLKLAPTYENEAAEAQEYERPPQPQPSDDDYESTGLHQWFPSWVGSHIDDLNELAEEQKAQRFTETA